MTAIGGFITYVTAVQFKQTRLVYTMNTCQGGHIAGKFESLDCNNEDFAQVFIYRREQISGDI